MKNKFLSLTLLVLSVSFFGYSQERAAKIINGQDVQIESHPYQVDINGCGASIIGERWLYTASHCVQGANPASIRVRAGITKKSESGGQSPRVKRILTLSSPDKGDLTLLELETPLDLSGPKAKAIRYASPAVIESGLLKKGKPCIATGWGQTDPNGSGSDNLRMIEIIFGRDAKVTDEFLRADEVDGKMVCRGDSGGPLVVRNLANTEYILVGGVQGGEGEPCSDYGFWSNAAKAAKWIEEQTGIPPYSEDTTPVPPTPTTVDGGNVATSDNMTEVTTITGDGIADSISFETTSTSSESYNYLITDEVGKILAIENSSHNFEGASIGICRVYGISYKGNLNAIGKDISDTGLAAGDYDVSDNWITVTRIEVVVPPPAEVDGGTITGGPFTFTVGDGVADNVTGISLSGNKGKNAAWVITDADANILEIKSTLADVEATNFDDAPAGVCLIWHISFEDDLEGAEAGKNAADLKGTFDLSNSITVNRTSVVVPPVVGQAIPGKIEAEDFDKQSGTLSQATKDIDGGQNIGYIENGDYTEYNVTVDEAGKYNVALRIASATEGGTITLSTNDTSIGEINVPATSGWQNWETISTTVDLDAGSQILRLDFAGGAGYLFNVNYMNFTGDASSTVVEGGEITGGPFEFIVGDGIADNAAGIVLSGNEGKNAAWVITDADANILEIKSSLTDVEAINFDGTSAGICLIWHISYEDDLEGAEAGKNATDLKGTFDLSNAITVTRNEGNTSPNTSCAFGSPITAPLESTYSFFRYAHVLGDNGPDFSTLKAFSFIWNLEANKLWRFGLLTQKAVDSSVSYVNLATTATHKLNEAQPEITFSNTGIEKFDGSYYVTKDGKNLVLVSKNDGFTIYFSRNETTPDCDGSQGKKSTNLDINLVLSPNPTSGVIEVSGTGSLTSGKVELFSLTGQRLKTVEINSNKNITFDLSEFQAGIYLVRVFSLEQSITKKIQLIK